MYHLRYFTIIYFKCFKELKMKKWIAFFLITITLFSAIAEDEMKSATQLDVALAYYIDDNMGYEVPDGGFTPITYTPVTGLSADPGDAGRDLGSGWGGAELEAVLSQTLTMPFLVGDSPLMEGNNAAFKFSFALSPVSAELGAEAAVTPIAFLNFAAGLKVGTGWNAVVFNGLGLNTDGSGTPLTDSFPGAVLKVWGAGTFQFDLAALMPGDWNHVVLIASPKIEYQLFSAAGTGDAWQYKADAGMNFNGFRLYGTYFLGYQMPLVLDTVGILLETNQNLWDTADLSKFTNGGWGSDFLQLTFGPLFNFKLAETSSLAVLCQFITERNYTQSTIGNKYYANRVQDGSYIDFYRLAFSYTQKL